MVEKTKTGLIPAAAPAVKAPSPLVDIPENAGNTIEEHVRYLASLGCTRTDIARLLRMPLPELERQFAVELSEGRATRRYGLWRGLSDQIKDAPAATLAGLLAKQEAQDQDEAPAAVSRPFRSLSDEELEKAGDGDTNPTGDTARKEAIAKEKEIRELERDPAKFVRAAWQVLYPGRELVWSWHYDLLCEHLLLVKQGKNRRLIVNVPPRTAKSTFFTICFPCWLWTTEPSHNFLCASYSRSLSDDHSVMRRQLLESEWFQQRWGGDFTIGAGQDMKSQFDNSRGGQMIATSVGATVTGKGGDTLIVDDPTSADEALSDAMRANANHWFDNTLRSRLNDPATGAIVVIMQRLHEQDLTGFLLETEPGVWTHLRIPLVEDLFTTEDAKDTEEIQSNCHSLLAPLAGEESMQSSCPSSTSSDDVASCESLAVRTKSPGGAEDVSPGRMPRPLRQESGVGSPPGTESRRDDRKGRYYPFPVSEVDYFRETGDILQPERFTPEVVERLKARGLVFAGQYQQLPAPMEGNLIKRSQVRYYGGVDPASGAPDEALPEKFDREIISVDCAFKDHADSDFVALGRIGVKGRKHYVLNVVNAHLGMGGTEEAIRRELSGRRVAAVLIEDKANGTAVIERLKANVNGVIPVNPEGGKLARFMAMQPEWEAGDWYVARNAAWTPALIEQLVTFPSARHDDMCDMLSQAAIWLGKAKTGPENWLKYWRENGPGAKKKVQPTPWWDGERFY